MPSCIETEKLSAKFPWTHRRRESVFSEKGQERSKHHHAEESLPGGVSLYHPDFAGFWFLALAYGIYMNANGFSFVYPMLMSMLLVHFVS